MTIMSIIEAPEEVSSAVLKSYIETYIMLFLLFESDHDLPVMFAKN